MNAPTLSLNFNVEDDNYNVGRMQADAFSSSHELAQVIAAVDRDFSSFGQVISSMFLDKNSYIVHFSTENNQLYRDRLRCVRALNIASASLCHPLQLHQHPRRLCLFFLNRQKSGGAGAGKP